MEVLVTLLSQKGSGGEVTYRGKFHTIIDAGLNPLPVQRPIPIWMGGESDSVLRRSARLADGWFPDSPPEVARGYIERLRRYAQEVGRDPVSIDIEGRVHAWDGNLDTWVKQAQEWASLNATHLSFDTMGAGFTSLQEHIETLRRFKMSITS